MVMGVLVTPAHTAPAVFDHQWDFSAANVGNPGIQTIVGINGTAGTRLWTAGANSHVASGTEIGLLGPFAAVLPFEYVGNSEIQYLRGVRITLGTPGGEDFDHVTVSFQLWVINSWDGSDGGLNGPDYFQVGVSSNVGANFIAPTAPCATGAGNFSLSCETYSNLGLAAGSAGAPTHEVGGDGRGSFSSTIASNGYSIYDINLVNVPVSSVNGQMTLFLMGWQNQGALDESWAISNLQITGFAGDNGNGNGGGEIPEPSTLVLGGIGLLLLGLARRRTSFV